MGNRIFFQGKKNVEKYREGPDPDADRERLTQLYEFLPILNLPQKLAALHITYKKREAHVVQVPALVVTSECRAAAYPGDSRLLAPAVRAAWWRAVERMCRPVE